MSGPQSIMSQWDGGSIGDVSTVGIMRIPLSRRIVVIVKLKPNDVIDIPNHQFGNTGWFNPDSMGFRESRNAHFCPTEAWIPDYTDNPMKRPLDKS